MFRPLGRFTKHNWPKPKVWWCLLVVLIIHFSMSHCWVELAVGTVKWNDFSVFLSLFSRVYCHIFWKGLLTVESRGKKELQNLSSSSQNSVVISRCEKCMMNAYNIRMSQHSFTMACRNPICINKFIPILLTTVLEYESQSKRCYAFVFHQCSLSSWSHICCKGFCR